jgi:hypothetical protein
MTTDGMFGTLVVTLPSAYRGGGLRIRHAGREVSFMLGNLCLEAGLEPDAAITSLLYSGYALEDWCSARKFGPNYVKFRTPLTNIRITTFVSNETEVKVIDPNKLEVIEAVGRRVREACI